jgi:phosphopantetheine adenylyltransferase
MKISKEEIAKKRRKEDIERLSNRFQNMQNLMQNLIGEFGMIKAIHSRIQREEYEKDQYDWKKDKSLSVNK